VQPTADERFWRETLAGFAVPTRMACEPHVLASGTHGDHKLVAASNLDPVWLRTIEEQSAKLGIEVCVLCYAAWARLLGAYSGESDLVFGVVSGPLSDGWIPLRVRIVPGARIEAWLQALQRDLLDARNHDAGLARICAWSEVLPDTSLLSTLVSIADLQRSSTRPPWTQSMQWRICIDKGMRFELWSAAHKADDGVMQGMLEQLQSLMERLVADPCASLWRVPVMAGAHADRVLHEWNATAQPFDIERTMHSMAERHAMDSPHSLAIVATDGRLSYGELDARANQLAWQLLKMDVRPGGRVGLCVDKSAAAAVAMLAVMKIGAAYVPLDPSYPSARLAYMVDDARLDALLTAGRGNQPVKNHPLPLLSLDEQWDRINEQPRTRPAIVVPPDALAYVIYTSGSSGQPKGVMVNHRGRVNNIEDYCRRFSMHSGDRILCVSSLSFDISVCNLFCMLNVGGCLIFPDPAREKDPQHWLELMAREHVSLWHSAPSLMDALLSAASETPYARDVLRVAVLDGDWIPLDQPQRTCAAFPKVEFVSAGGATELSIDSMMYVVAEVDPKWRSIPYGRPMANQIALILDSNLELVPAGVPGELYLGGTGVGAGYHYRPTLTAERFIPHPWPNHSGERLYRTGDLARYGTDGLIELLGRVDFQVKIRGVRIELGEVEAALVRLPSIAQCVVTARKDQLAQLRLVAYVVAPDGAVVDGKALRDTLSEMLPAHMIPAVIVQLPSLPLTPNGKLDRTALPEPNFERIENDAPRTPEEATLAGYFADILKLRYVGVHDNFFDAGGHSLLATRLISRVRASLGAELSLIDIFECPTVAALAQRLNTHASRVPLVPYERSDGDLVPLSYAQQRLWLIDQLQGDGTYNIPIALRLHGILDLECLELALRDVFVRHEALRTRLIEFDGIPYQQVLNAQSLKIELNLRKADEAALPGLMAEAATEGFDFATEYPMRAHVLRVAEQDHLLLLVLHHIAGDGWSLTPLARDLSYAYGARRAGHEPGWESLPVQYADYSLWQREVLGEEDDRESIIARQGVYWRKQLAGLAEQIELPFDRARPTLPDHHGDVMKFHLEATLHRQLLTLAREHHVTLFMLMHAALAVTLHKLGAGSDIAIGTPIAGRTDGALDDLVGFFVNSLVLRVNLDGNPSLEELLAQVRAVDLAAYAHQDFPFERLVDMLNPARVLNRHPLFQVAMVLQNNAAAAFELDGLTVHRCVVDIPSAKFDLALNLTDCYAADASPQGVDGYWEYATTLFEKSTIEALNRRFMSVLAAFCHSSRQRLASLSVLTPTEREYILDRCNDTAKPLSQISITQAFADQVARAPHATALVFGDETLSYAQLDAWSDALADRLLDRGANPEQGIAILMERSPMLVVALLATLKAGGFYVPLHPQYPDRRIRQILDDTRSQVLLTDCSIEARSLEHITIIRVDQLPKQSSLPSQGRPRVWLHNLAYVTYTSGSSGMPKGVAVCLQDVVALALDRRFDHGHDCVLMHSPLAFDASTYEIWVPLLRGGRIVIAPPGQIDAADLQELIAKAGVHAFFATTALFNDLVASAPSLFGPLQQIWTGGEAASIQAMRRLQTLYPALGIVNGYGPTETTTFALSHALKPVAEDAIAIPIGDIPLDNMQIYILDGKLQPVPTNVVGELYIAGAGLARCYWNRPTLTAERFVAHPFAQGRRMYRTGDLARRRLNGYIEFVGRTDTQVKLRGFRIELAEIEAALARQPELDRCAVIVREDHPGIRQIVAYVVAAKGHAIDPSALRHALADDLPSYMVPAAIVPLTHLPRNTNGKLDHKALPVPDMVGVRSKRAPRTPQEELLKTLFAETLALADIGIDDNFFELGGHSLLAAQLIGRIRSMLDLKLSIRALFEAPTVARFADRLLSSVALESSTAALLPLRAGGDRPAIFCFHPASGLSWAYARLMHFVDARHPLYGLQARGFAHDERAAQTLQEMVADYVSLMRSVQPSGPYHLLGWSFGGLLSHAVGCELQRQGERIGLLAILDTGFLHQPMEEDAESGLLDEIFSLEGIERSPTPITDLHEAYELLRARNSPFASLGEELFERSLHVYRNNIRLFRQSPPRDLFQGDLLLISSMSGKGDSPMQSLVTDGWRQCFTGQVQSLQVECGHFELFDSRHAPGICKAIGEKLAVIEQDWTHHQQKARQSELELP